MEEPNGSHFSNTEVPNDHVVFGPPFTSENSRIYKESAYFPILPSFSSFRLSRDPRYQRGQSAGRENSDVSLRFLVVGRVSAVEHSFRSTNPRSLIFSNALLIVYLLQRRAPIRPRGRKTGGNARRRVIFENSDRQPSFKRRKFLFFALSELESLFEALHAILTLAIAHCLFAELIAESSEGHQSSA